jgi:hypothetical protein
MGPLTPGDPAGPVKTGASTRDRWPRAFLRRHKTGAVAETVTLIPIRPPPLWSRRTRERTECELSVGERRRRRTTCSDQPEYGEARPAGRMCDRAIFSLGPSSSGAARGSVERIIGVAYNVSS